MSTMLVSEFSYNSHLHLLFPFQFIVIPLKVALMLTQQRQSPVQYSIE